MVFLRPTKTKFVNYIPRSLLGLDPEQAELIPDHESLSRLHAMPDRVLVFRNGRGERAGGIAPLGSLLFASLEFAQDRSKLAALTQQPRCEYLGKIREGFAVGKLELLAARVGEGLRRNDFYESREGG